MNTSVEWIILITKNYEQVKCFYRDILALPIVRDVPEEEFTQYALNNCFLAIYGASFVESLLGVPISGTPGNTIYSLKESDDIDTEYQQLTNKGVQFVRPPTTQPWGQRTAYFTDPDGNIWELQQWMSKKIKKET